MKRISILYFGDCWDEMWRRRQQMAWRLAHTSKVEQVIYVEDPLTPYSLAKFLFRRGHASAVERWQRIMNVHSFVHYMSDKLCVVTPLAILGMVGLRPLLTADRLARYASMRFLLRRLQCPDQAHNWLLWVSVPWIPMRLLEDFSALPLWYDCSEDLSEKGNVPIVQEMIRRNDMHLTKRANVVTVNSRLLQEEKKDQNSNLYWIPNGADLERLACGRTNIPADIADLPRPRIVFVGSLDFSQDWDLLEWTVAHRPDWSWILIGGIADPGIKRRFSGYKSVRFLGRKPYRELGDYLAHVDVGIQFYKVNHFNDSRNSLKFPLYLSAGKPVVSTPTAGAENYAHLIHIAPTAEEFVASIEQALAEESVSHRQARIEASRQNSWDARMKEIGKLIELHLS